MTTGDKHFDAREIMEMLHKMFRREFSLVPGLVRDVPGGDHERAKAVSGHLAFITTALHNHHTFEDEQVWPVLVERDTQGMAADVHHVQEQHEGIEAAAFGVADSVTAWGHDAAESSRDRLADSLDALVPLLLQHMEFEEKHVVPLMEKHILHDEWNRMIQTAAVDLDPLDMPLEFGTMMYEGDPEIVELTISNMPEELRPVIGKTAVRTYAEHAERVHGTATPPRSTEL